MSPHPGPIPGEGVRVSLRGEHAEEYGLQVISNMRVGISSGTWVNPAFRRLGLGTTVLTKSLEHEIIRRADIFAWIHSQNAASQRLFETIGFTRSLDEQTNAAIRKKYNLKSHLVYILRPS